MEGNVFAVHLSVHWGFDVTSCLVPYSFWGRCHSLSGPMFFLGVFLQREVGGFLVVATKAGSMHAFLFIAGSLESGNSSILAAWRLFKEVVGKKIRILC